MGVAQRVMDGVEYQREPAPKPAIKANRKARQAFLRYHEFRQRAARHEADGLHSRAALARDSARLIERDYPSFPAIYAQGQNRDQ